MRPGFEIIGHRGARGLFPENTLEGFEAALALGVRRFEIDIAVTADNVPVLYHDFVLNPDLTRGPDGAWLTRPGPPLRRLTLASLSAYDVGRIRPGSAYAARHPVQKPSDGARIPTLAAALAAAPEAHFTIELKTDPTRPELAISGPEMAEHVVAVAEAAGALGRIRIESFDWSGPRHLARTRPEIARAWLTEPKTAANAPAWWGVAPAGRSLPQLIADEGGGAWAPAFETIGAADIAAASRLSIDVLPWTINEPVAMSRLAGWGVGGLITDRPDLALALFAE
ncbi:MAG TPA: glycerophosphodiester phosphodiesterase family protein [Acetobacteraceae bacterium]|nr:glycerophosphodiester phosphodiesterase family protein [Acetobacteraceae bacterium]